MRLSELQGRVLAVVAGIEPPRTLAGLEDRARELERLRDDLLARIAGGGPDR